MADDPVFFLTDFGLSDAYVGIVKAVMKRIASDVEVVDLAHELPPQDLRRGAYQLYEAVPYLPAGSIVLAVVDPGVGSARRPVVVESARHRWIAPDNGLLSLAFAHDPPERAYVLEKSRYRLADTSATFHARDVFGPAAAHVARGVPPEEFGPEVAVDELVRLPVELTSDRRGEVLTFDRFGNAITTLRAEAVQRGALRIGDRIVPFGSHYAEVEVGEAIALVGSAGLVEVSVRDGSAREALELEEGAAVEVGGR